MRKITFILCFFVFSCTCCFGQTTVTYPASNTFFINTITSVKPTITGTAPASFAIQPALPVGLSFDTITGTITSTNALADVSPGKNYIVTAKITGAADIPVNVLLQVMPPNIYVPSAASFTVDSTIVSMKPNVTLQYVKYEVKGDPLPKGLTINNYTGEITGVPLKATPATTFHITATLINSPGTPPIDYYINISAQPQADVVKDPPTISFVGQGNIQQSLNSGAAIAANTGIGVVYRQNSSRRYGVLHNIEVDFSINVASTVDTIKSVNNSKNEVTNKQDFGNSVLIPTNSGQAFSFNFKGYFTERGGPAGNYKRNSNALSLGGVLSGFNIAFSGSNRNWEYVEYTDPASTAPVPAPVSVKTSLLSLYVGPFFEFVTPSKSNNYGQNASITLGAGYSGRWILGDVQQGDHSNLRSSLLGSTTNSFNGYEVLLALRFYNIKAEVHVPFLSNKANIPGLSGTHMTTFIGFSGGFPIDLTKKSNP